MDDYLFYKRGDLRDFLDARLARALAAVDAMGADEFLNTSPAAVCEALVASYALESPVLRPQDKAIREAGEVDIDVSRDPMRAIRNRSRPFYVKGTRVTVSVPFDGDPELFEYEPSVWLRDPPCGEVRNREAILTYTGVALEAESLKRDIGRDVARIQEYLDRVRSRVDEYNGRLLQTAEDAVARRRKRLLEQSGLMEALGIPLCRRTNAPETYTLPVHRRPPAIERLLARTAPFTPEPALEPKDYEAILDIIQRMAEVIERSPSAFADMGEEQLRDHFLVQLNGQYEWAAGEVFSREGKTDILLRYESKVAFIAECKFWEGPKSLQEAIDQILRYTTWRDTKTAVLLFSRRASFSKVLEQIPGAVRAHACCKRAQEMPGETRCRFVLGRPDDPNREILLTVCAFDVPKAFAAAPPTSAA